VAQVELKSVAGGFTGKQKDSHPKTKQAEGRVTV